MAACFSSSAFYGGCRARLLEYLLDQELSDAAIKVHFTGIRKCLEHLGRPTDAQWLQYSAKNAPQLDLEIAELRRLTQWKPTAAHLAEERDRWLFQRFSERRYEDLAKFESGRQRATLQLKDGSAGASVAARAGQNRP